METPNAKTAAQEVEQPQVAKPAGATPSTNENAPSRLVALSDIHISPTRQRRTPREAKPLLELKKSILSKGLLHPPVIARRTPSSDEPQPYQLIAGERRLIAMGELHTDGLKFHYNGDEVPVGFIPYTTIAQLSDADLEEAELEENIIRLNLPWQEECEAKLRIHELRKAQNPNQRLIDTGTELIAKGTTGLTQEEAQSKANTQAVELRQAEAIAPYMHLPAVAQAKTLRKAYLNVIDLKRAKLAGDLQRLSTKTTAHTIVHGDFLEVSKTLSKGHYDLLLSDPPYGVDMHKQGFERRHEYDDSKDTALNLYREILRRGFHLLKPQGHVFLFCDIEHFITIRTYAEQQAFVCWRTPIIWHKSSDGPAPWGRNGFQRTYECGLFAVKGQRPLALGPEPDLKTVPRTARGDRLHAAEKPPEFLRWLLRITTQPGCRVLDPCAGSAPVLAAAKDLGLELTLIEKDEEYYKAACLRAQELETETTPEVDVREPFTLANLEDDIFSSTESNKETNL